MKVNLSPGHPLTLAQRDIYFHQLHQPESAMYNVGGYLVLECTDLPTLERAHQKVIERHDAFGIRIHASTEGVQQRIATDRSTDLLYRDFSELPQPEKAAKAWLADVFQTPFQLYDQELYKTFLVKIGPNQHWYAGVAHHLMMDGWGFTNWARELDRLYQQPQTETKGPDISWVQIVAEDQAYANSSKFERDRAYWQETLPMAPERLLEPHYRADFPANKPVPSQRESRILPASAMAALNKLSEETKLSLPSLFLALLTTYYAGEKRRDSLVFGLPVHNRRGRRQKRMLGVFTGISPFVMRCKQEDTFLDLAHHIQGSLKTHFRHQRYPIGRLTRDLGMAGSDQLLYDVCFNFLKLENPFEDEATPSSLHYLSNSQEPTPLTLTLWQVGNDRPIEMQAEFNHAYFKVEEIRLLLDRLLFLIDQVCSAPTTPIGHILLIPSHEQAMIQRWQGEKLAYDASIRVHQLFEAQAKAHPERIALYHEGTQLTYASLNEYAHKLALALIQAQLGPQHLVGLYLSRGPEMVVAMLGAMKAGVPYVPLDPNYPESRLRIMLQAGKVAYVLTESGLQERIAAEGIPTILVSEVSQAETVDPSSLPERSVLGTSHHAYVLFTSGSTGLPKGVAISHANVSAMIHWGQTAFTPEELERVLVSTSLNFDISVFEVFLPLCSGQSCVIVENALALFEKAPRPPVTLINTVPSAIRALLEQGAVPSSARVVNLAGEALPQDTVNQLLHLVPKVFNLYGPTEDTTYSTYACFQKTLTTTPVIGRPIANSQALVLGPGLKPMPVGAVGELFLGGAGVTRGYVNRTAETASRFIPHPEAEGQRLYRTGDLVRWLPHGQLQFLGRFDDQIKLRGFRIELQEIVAQLLNQTMIKDAAVIVRGQQDKQTLVAYVVLSPEGQESLAQTQTSDQALPEILRLALRANLPEYMVPAAFVALEKLPLTPNGKINRQALPQPEREHLTVSASAAMPRTPVERQLQTIWQDILQTSPIGIHDNFFELGGDSILAIQIMTKSHQRGLHLAPGDLFSNPSIAALAEVTRREKMKILGTEPDSGPITPLPIQQWFLESGMAEPAHFNQAVLLDIDPAISSSALEAALRQLHRHHDALRLRFDIEGLEPIHYTDAAEPFFEEQAFQGAPTDLADWVFSRTSRLQRSLNLKDGPLVAAGHFKIPQQDSNLLFLAIHHLVVDGVSWRILLEDLTTLLKAQTANKPTQLPEKTTSLGAWSAKLSESRGNLFYWLNWPKTVAPATFRALADGSVSLGNLFAGNTETLTLQLDPEMTQDLIKHPAAIYRLGVQEVLLAALGRALAVATERWDMMFDLESHGREQGLFENMDLSRTVGWFTAVYPFRLALEAKGKPEDDLLAVKACMHEVPHKGLFFDAERVNTPQAAVLFNYLGRFETTLQPPFLGHASHEAGSNLSPLAKRRHVLEIDAMLLKDGLKMTWTFCSNHLKHAQVESVAIAFQSQLQRLVKHCATQEQRRLTPSDFPLAELSQEGVDQLAKAHPEAADIYPLSPVQEGMLFHALFGERKEAYFEQLTCRFEGQLECNLFQQAWNDMIGETPALATAFAWEQSGQPLQIIQRNPRPQWHEEDLSHLAEQAQQDFIQQFLTTDRQAGFALDQAPLIRFALFKTSPTSWAFVWSYHHLLMDGWSMSLVLDEVLGHYRALIGGQRFIREKRPPFRHFIARARNQDLTESRRFWREHLAGFEAPLVLPLQKGTSSHRIAHENRNLPNKILADLQTVGKAHGVTLSTCIQAAWAILLARYCHTRDVVFGLTVSGRETGEEDLTQTIGLLINTVPVRVVFQEDQTLKACLAELQTQTIARESHGGLPQADIQACSSLTSGQELFDYLLVVENYPLDPERLHHGLGFEIADVGAAAFTHYGLTVVARAHDGLHFQIAYDTGKFTGTAVEGLLDQLATLLEGLAAALSRSIREPQTSSNPLDLPLLNTTAQQQLTHRWNQVALRNTDSGGIHQRFEAQAAAHPQREALVLPAHKRLDGVEVPAQSLSYGQLNQAANRLAQDLIQRGAGPETLVGLHVERSLEMVIGILGILKSGAAYVPLDPVYPSERLAFITTDAQLKWVIVQQDMDEKLPAGAYQRIPLDIDLASDVVTPNPTPPPTISGQTAYIIYTSGSTGKPKGVPVTHNNVVRLFETSHDLFEFNDSDTWTLFHSYAFDFTVWELWGALIYGGRLVIVPQMVARSAESFHQLLHENQVTVLNQTPSAFVRLIQADEHADARLDALRYVIFGGEALEPQSLIPWFAKYGDAKPQLVNMYGITETTVHVTFGPIGRIDCQTGGSNLGVRLPDLSLFLLDAKLRPVPFGVKGEIFVGGGGVARGYLHQPALTAQRFVPNPFASQAGARLYRSGDLGRFRERQFMDLPLLEYAGRCDFQVKIRGYRIELGEIEAALLGFEAVRDTVVLAREDLPGPGGKQLVAYLAGTLDVPSAEIMHQELMKNLPDYMIPAHFVRLDTLPLTAHGKVDRAKLPLPHEVEQPDETEWVAPTTVVEKQLAAIWSQVLDLDSISIRQRFFELGGDSILSIRVMTAAKRAGLLFTLPQLFELQTIEKLAEVVTQTEARSATALEPFALVNDADRAKLPQAIENAYPATLLQKGMLFHAEKEKDAYHNLTSFHLNAAYNEEFLREAVTAVMERHDVLRTAFDLSHFSEPLQLVAKHVEVPINFTDWRHLDSRAQDRAFEAWFESEKQAFFDWSQAGLLRFSVQRRGDAAFQFTLTEHHAILDGWSVASLFTEVFRYYFARLQGENPEQTPLPKAGFVDFVALEKQTLAHPDAGRYWADHLDGFEFTRIPRYPNRDADPAHLEVPLAAGLSEKVLALAEETGVPLKAVLLAVHYRVLVLLTGQDDVLTGLVSNGRPEEEGSERVLGLFLNTLPMRYRMTDLSWVELARDIFALERQTLPHRRYPLAQIQKMFGGKPFFETAFNYTHFHIYQTVRHVPGLDLVDTTFYAPTHVPFAANFSRDLENGKVLLSLDYRADTFPHAQAEAIAGYYQTALEHLVTHPTQSSRQIAFLKGERRDQVLLDWNQTQVPRQGHRGLHELVTEQARKTPEKTAIVALDQTGGRRSLSFAELDTRSSQLAHWLLKCGARQDQPIALCLERSPEAIVAILATLKAGCAYVPLDPAYPDDRLAFMIEDSGAVMAIAQQAHAGRLATYSQVVDLDAMAQDIEQQPESQPPVTIHPENAAYVIYTSGSTGLPKGVVISHRAILNQMYWRQQVFNLAEDDRMLQNLSLSFDPSVWQIFWPLSIGAQIYLIPNAAQRDIPWLAKLMLQHRLAGIAMVPSVLRVLLDEEAFLACDHLKHISCGGEGLPADLVTRFCEHFGEEGILHVVYGPTEATIDASTWHARKQVPTRIAPIGLPIHNAQLYVLDSAMQAVPPGVPGELYIAGDGLGRGYLNRAGLTADRYVPNAFAQDGSRLYRSGDQVRYLENGLLEFLGRVDHQVKVRGFRIELGELEAILAEHPQIDEVACLVREDQPGEKRLVAYLHFNDEPEIPPRRWMAERVPDYMVPAVFVTLDDFPRLPNDKINRQRLPKPEAADRQTETAFTPAQTPVQRELAAIWETVLDLERVGIHDNFFELGGDSILSLQIIARAREVGLELSPKHIFENQTIASLAEVAATLEGVRIEQEPLSGPALLSPFQQQLLEDATQASTYQAVLLKIPVAWTHEQLAQSLNHLLQHHDSLRLTFERDERDAWVQRYVEADQPFPLTLVSSDAEPLAWPALVRTHLADASAAMALGENPLCRAIHFQFQPADGAPEARLYLVAHRLIIDQESWPILVADLASLCEQSQAGKALSSPAKTSALRDWTAKLEALAQEDASSEALRFWQDQQVDQALDLGQADELLRNTHDQTDQMTLRLNREQTSALQNQAAHAYHTDPDQLLLTALTLAWQEWQSGPLALEHVTSSRTQSPKGLDLSRSVGCFTTTYPLCLQIDATDLDTVIKAVKQQITGMPRPGYEYAALSPALTENHPTTDTSIPAQVRFNSAWSLPQVKGTAFEVLHFEQSHQGQGTSQRPALLDWDQVYVDGDLEIRLTWPTALFEKAHIAQLFEGFGQQLDRVIEHCLQPQHGGRTPADFPLVELNQAQVDTLVGQGKGIEDVLPLAPTQQDILFHVVYREGALFHQQLHLVIEQAIDVARFQAAWNWAIHRHIGLRTSFHWQGLDQPVQVVHEQLDLPWQLGDWQKLSAEAHQERLATHLAEDRRQPFDWTQPPLMRFGLFQLDDNRYQFVWSHHFLLSDGWSLPLILKDVLAFYFEEVRDLRAMPQRSFRNYLAWIHDQDLDAAKAWWRNMLEGFREPSALPFDRLVEGETGPSSHGKVHSQLSLEVTEQLKQFAKQQRLTVNTLVQAAWSLVLGYHNHSRDVLFGSSVSGRPVEISGIGDMVGLFINTLPVRAALEPSTNVATWLHTLQDAQQERESRSTTPALVIRGESEVAADQPLYESIVVFENFPVDPALLDKRFQFSNWIVEEQTNFPLSLTAELNDAGLMLDLTYHTIRFQRDLVTRMLAHFELLLGQMETHYQRRIHDFQHLSEEHKQAMLSLGSARQFPIDTRCLHQLIEASALETPQNTAVVAVTGSESQRLTYAELNLRAQALALHLVEQGVGPETYVGIFLDKCVELPVAILAVLKTGAAFVPLSPDYPTDRLASMANQANLALLITKQTLVANAPCPQLDHVCLDDIELDWDRQGALPQRDHRNHPAYLIFSSGSTGKPKGITVSHGSIVNAARAWEIDYQLREQCKVHLQMAAFSFDVFVGDFARALTTSAALVLCPKETLLDPQALWHLIQQEQVDAAEFVPAVMRELATHLETSGQDLSQFRLVVVGSDAWSMQELARVRRLCGPETRLINSYGVTEAAVDSTYLEETQLALAPERMVPIGRPYHNTRPFVLNRDLEAVAMGVTGLLFIGGPGLARGYHNNPRATAEKFVPHPYGETGDRLYRSDDSARILPDGQIDFLGRIDNQIKLRGLRIELGEIEAALATCAGVDQAVVILREDGPKTLGPQLVAYTVGQAVPEPDTLRGSLARQLPDYMVPAFLMHLDSFPLTPSGKVDRRHLPAPAWDQFNFGRTTPETDTERSLATLWADTLGREIPSMEANFFQLGGHSLLATRLISNIRDQFEVELPLRTLFESPTIALMAAALDAAQATSSTLGPPLVKSDAEPILSFGQKRLWFIEQMAGSSAAYNLGFGLQLQGDLNRDYLEQAVLRVIDRHESLRSSMVGVDGKPQLVIQPTPQKGSLPFADLSDSQNIEADVEALFTAETGQPFNLESGPLLRLRLVRTAPDTHLFMVTMHHIISDAWSIGVMITELSLFYSALSKGEAPSLPPLALQYSDYAHWQQAYLSEGRLETQLAWWQGQLRCAPPSLDLPFDRPRAAVRQTSGASFEFALGQELTEKVRALAEETGTTLFMNLIGAYALLLGRYSRSDDLVIGTPIANRTRAELEPMIGFFVNTLALRFGLGDGSWRDHLAQIRDMTLNAYAHQDLPFERLVEALDVPRDASHEPVFQVMFMLQNAFTDHLELPGLEVTTKTPAVQEARFELYLALEERDSGLHGFWEYNCDLFNQETVEQMADQYRNLLEQLTATPDQSINQVKFTTAAQRSHLIDEHQRRLAKPLQAPNVPAFIEAQVERTPELPAVVTDTRTLSYQALNSEANRLAHSLRSRGVGPEVAVAIVAKRSVETIIGQLAVLKAGGWFLPIDPQLPDARITYIFADAKPTLLLAAAEDSARFAAFDLDTMALDDSPSWSNQCENPTSLTNASATAYAMYTSGTTGVPKGVAIPHRGILSLIESPEYFAIQAGDKALHFASLAFDATTFEVWASLAHGAQIYIFPQGPADVGELCQFIDHHQISIAFLTTGFFNSMVEHGVASLTSLRYLLTGGQAISPHHARQFKETLPDCVLVNSYGPTEATTFAVCHPVSPSDFDGSLPIGKPINYRATLILDKALRLTGPQITGELFIAGPCLARGYLNKPALTAQAFLPDPYAAEPGSRFYASGDLAFLNGESNIIFCGREDDQVKIRGFRIETGEIEECLLKHDQLRQAVVIPRKDLPGGEGLVAFFVSSGDGDELDASQITAFLKKSLPEFMVPALFVPLEAMPINRNGKVDRNVLGRTALDNRLGGHVEKVAPRTETEKQMAAIWAEILETDSLSIHDNFFEVGGHSLLATQIVSRIRSTFKVETPLSAFFEAPTIAQLAHLIENQSVLETLPDFEPLNPEDKILELSFGQQRLWFLNKIEPGQGHTSGIYNISTTIDVEGQLDLASLQTVLTQLEIRHQSLRTNILEEQGQPIQVIRTEPHLKVIHLDSSDLMPEQFEALIQDEATRNFDLAEDPLLRLVAIKQDEDKYLLILTMHHIISDGWSINILVQELVALYREALDLGPAELPPLPMQYSEYARWQQRPQVKQILDEQASWWQEKLAHSPICHELPLDRPRPPVQSHRGGHVPMVLDLETKAQLERLAKKSESTLFMVLLAGFKLLLSRYSGQSDILIGSPIAGRNRAEIEPLIGMFVNTLVMRSLVDEALSFEAFLAEVRKTALEAYAHQEVPFEQVLDRIQPPRHMGHAPLFQIMFVMQTQGIPELEMENLKLTPRSNQVDVAKFDLTLDVQVNEKGLFANWEYNADIFNQTTIETMANHFVALLKAIPQHGQQPMDRLEFITPAERLALVRDTHQNTTQAPLHLAAHQLFEAQVAKQPQQLALLGESTHMTYADLNTRANQIAWQLLERGVTADSRVAVLMERSWEMVAGILAILKSGASYLPIDENFPQQRIETMLADGAPVLTLTKSRYLDNLAGHANLCLDQAELFTGKSENIKLACDSDQAAYLIYTSGSTGTPKASINSHRGLVNHVLWLQRAYPLTQEDRVAFKTPLNFDVATREIFWTLSSGATLAMATPGTQGDPAYLKTWIAENDITVIYFVGSMLKAFVDHSAEEAFPSKLRLLFTGGESLPPAVQRKALLLANDSLEMISTYGPSEAAISSTSFFCGNKPIHDLIPLGTPIDNMTAYVVDRHLRLTPQGVPGELVLGGPGLSRGYHQRPGLTATQFIANPFTEENAGSRLYRTGDFVRRLPSGDLQFLGRIDGQIKLRGLRIELGDISAQLHAVPEVTAAEVLISQSARDEQALIAFVQTRASDWDALVDTLKAHLKANVPAFMVPNIFVPVDAWPRLPSGKVSQKVLLELGQSHQALQRKAQYTPPRNEIEESIVAIWQKVLGLEQVGVFDNFFEIGGHSLLATQVHSRLSNLFPEALSLQFLFEEPTIAGIAKAIDGIRQITQQHDTAVEEDDLEAFEF